MLASWDAAEDAPPMLMADASVARFWQKVEKTEGCWLWRGSVISSGYGNFSWSLNGTRRWMLAHRAVIELTTSTAVPPDLAVDHLCRVRTCVNPEHLEVVSHGENARRAIQWRRGVTRAETCKRGHPWREGDYSTDRDGWRTCLICRRMVERQRSPEQRAARAAKRRAARAAGRNW